MRHKNNYNTRDPEKLKKKRLNERYLNKKVRIKLNKVVKTSKKVRIWKIKTIVLSSS